MQSKLNTFSFEGKSLRIVTGKDGEPHVVARDVAEVLGYSPASRTNIRKTIAHVPVEWKGRYPIPTPGGDQDQITLTEAGLFFFLSRSDKPAALPMQKWIAGEVLPSIRKTGSYTVPGAPVPVERAPRLTSPMLRAMREQIGWDNTTAWLVRTYPEQFGNLPNPMPAGPTPVVQPALGLVEPAEFRLSFERV